MTSFLATLFLFLLSFGVSALMMIHGWGVEPKSWTIIAFGWFGSVVLMALSGLVGKQS
jgi:hypothetical protein